MPTLLDIHRAECPDAVEGFSLLPLLAQDSAIREAAIYGRFGAATNVTDGRYSYFRYPDNLDEQVLNEYTLMPMRQRSLFTCDDFGGASLESDFAFARGFPILKLPAHPGRAAGQGAKIEDAKTVLYDLETGPGQANPIDDPEVEAILIAHMIRLMKQNEAPPEAFARLGLTMPDD
jgi:hypothetical protein